MNIFKHNTELLTDYLPIAIFFGIAAILALLLVFLPRLLSVSIPQKSKLAEYECGFDAFDDARGRFDVRFYLVAILFIIFDLEIAFLIPWSVSLKSIGVYGFWSMMFFLFILTIGFIYEWKQGALNWE